MKNNAIVPKLINRMVLFSGVFSLLSGICAAGECLLGWTRLRIVWLVTFGLALAPPTLLLVASIVLLMLENRRQRNLSK